MPKPTREQILLYAEDHLLNGLTKKESYHKNINPDISQVGQAVVRIEKTPEYDDIKQMMLSDEELKLRKQARVIRGKYANLLEKNIDTAIDILDGVKDAEIDKKAVAVRLVNETVGALSMVGGAEVAAGQPAAIDKSGAVS